MATRYLITAWGSVTWTAADTSIWSASSWGATWASVPWVGDDVIMDALSLWTCTLGYSPSVNSITMWAYIGTFDASTFSPTVGTMSNSWTAIRTLTMGSGTWFITGSGTSWDETTITNLTRNVGTSTVDFNYAGSNAVSIRIRGAYNIKRSAWTWTVSTSPSNWSVAWDMDFTGYSGAFTKGAWVITISGSLTLSPTMTWADVSTGVTFASTSTWKTITTNWVRTNCAMTFDGVWGGWSLVWNLDITWVNATALTLTNGSFNANNFNVKTYNFNSSNSNVRTLNMGSGTWEISWVTGTIWTLLTTTNLTFNAGTSTVKLTWALTNQVNFLWWAKTYYRFWNATTWAFAVAIWGSSNTFTEFIVNPGRTQSFWTPTSTQTITNPVFVWTPWNLITLNSLTGGTPFILAKANWWIVQMDYCSIQDMTGSPASTWYASNSTNVSGNTNVTFWTAPSQAWILLMMV